jgi:hypothetical protein
MVTVRQAKHELLKAKWHQISLPKGKVDKQSETDVKKTKSQPPPFTTTGVKQSTSVNG